MSLQRYNGWANYATWRVNLELIDGDNDYWNDLLDQMQEADPDDVQYEMTQAVEEHVQQILDSYDCGNSLIRSYADAFVSDVSYYEIAKHLIEAHKLEQQYQAENA